MGKSNTKCQNRIIYFEVLRIIAILFVIFNHTVDFGFYLYTNMQPGSIQFWTYLFMSVFCKPAIPLFFAISGALMLSRGDETIKKWMMRVLRFLITLVIVSFGYYLADICVAPDITFSIKDYFISLYSGTVKYHLWYLYYYIAFILALPLLKAMAKNLADKYFYFIFILAFVIEGLVPCSEYLISRGLISLCSDIKVDWLMGYGILYPLLGYFIHQRLSLKQIRRMLPVVWTLNLITIAFSCYITYRKGISLGGFGLEEEFHSCFVVVNFVAFFITARYLFENHEIPQPVMRIISSMGECTFGIYLLHIGVKDYTGVFFGLWRKMIDLGFNEMFVILLICVLVYSVCYALTLLLSKIPVVKKLVGF